MVGINRIRKYVTDVVKKYQLSLEGLTVLAEAATNMYSYTPIIAAEAGATTVYAVGSKKSQTIVKKEVKVFGVDNIVCPIGVKTPEIISQCDIIMNLKGVRPITRSTIQYMKSSAIITLMYEMWELRRDDIDIEACKEYNIKVVPTDEHKAGIFKTIGYKLLKMMFDSGMSVYSDKILVLSSGRILDAIMESFISFKLHFDCNLVYGLHEYDTIIVAEYESNELLIGKTGMISTEDLVKLNPTVQIIYTYGNVNKKDIDTAGLSFYPNVNPRPFGYMAVSADYLGYKPVMDYCAAGLKAGQSYLEENS